MLFPIVIVVEMIYFLQNLNLVLPHSFLVNLLQSFVSGSNTVSSLNGKVTSGAGYTTYKSWVETQGKNKRNPQSNDTLTCFNNIGKHITKSVCRRKNHHKRRHCDNTI